MKLWDVLSVGAYDQLVDIFTTNDYDENVRIGQGTFEAMRKDADVFDNLMLEVESIHVMNDKTLVERYRRDCFKFAVVLLDYPYSDVCDLHKVTFLYCGCTSILP